MKRNIIIGTRGSELALWQANWLKSNLNSNYPDVQFEIRIIKTQGDRFPDISLSGAEGKGFFTKAIEDALLDKSIDIAIHSLKDLPTELPAGLFISAVSSRENPCDVLVSNNYSSLNDLPEGASVAAGCLRRQCQLLSFRNDLRILDIRGNVTTRIKKLDESGWDGLILAYAGLKRLGLDERIRQLIPDDIILPAVGQGVMAVESREEDEEISAILHSVNNEKVFSEITAERSLLKTIEGGCQIPAGAYAVNTNGIINLKGIIGRSDGSILVHVNVSGPVSDAQKLGIAAGRELLDSGGREILNELRLPPANVRTTASIAEEN